MKKVYHTCSLHDDNNRADTNNANNKVCVLNSIDDHIAFVLYTPDVSISSSSISNNAKFVIIAHCVNALTSEIVFI